MTEKEAPRSEEKTTPLSDLDPHDGATITPRRSRVSLEPDRVIAKRYRIIRFIARGWMGEVYEAEDLEPAATNARSAARAESR